MNHTIDVSTAEVLEIWKMLKERESELNQSQYLLYKKAEKIVYAVFSVSELEKMSGPSVSYKGKQ
jgi:hypothetical protein